MYEYPETFDVLVLGAGHAGVEAGLAATRLGAHTGILTQNLDTIGQMSCNPAIGGLAKGHMVREIDALGGVMGSNTDATGIQFRMLNARKGPSVQAPRAQCDKKAYQFRLKWVLEHSPRLHLLQGNAVRILVEKERVVGGGDQPWAALSGAVCRGHHGDVYARTDACRAAEHGGRTDGRCGLNFERFFAGFGLGGGTV